MTPFHISNKAALPSNPVFSLLCKILVYKATKSIAVVGIRVSAFNKEDFQKI